MNRRALAALIATAMMLHGCGQPDPAADSISVENADEADVGAAGLTVDASLDEQGYSATPAYVELFSASECTDDCSGHNAGFDWARDKGITDPDDCGGDSRSFIEGCEAHAGWF